MRKQIEILEYQSCLEGCSLHVLPIVNAAGRSIAEKRDIIDNQRSSVSFLQLCHDSQQRALAAAGRPYYGKHLSLVKSE